MLVELTDEMKSSTLLTDLLLEAHRLGVQIRFTAVTARGIRPVVSARRARDATSCRCSARR